MKRPTDPQPPYGPRDWQEDADHENGGYQCECVHCKATFYGHKRRVVCKQCAERPTEAEKPPEIREEIRKVLLDTYACTRVWEAWQVGTMTDDDFHPAWEDDDILDGIEVAVKAQVESETAAPRAEVEEAKRDKDKATAAMIPLVREVLEAQAEGARLRQCFDGLAERIAASMWGYFQGGSAGSADAYAYFQNNKESGGPRHVIDRVQAEITHTLKAAALAASPASGAAEPMITVPRRLLARLSDCAFTHDWSGEYEEAATLLDVLPPAPTSPDAIGEPEPQPREG
jgi:hypothetical protein